MRSPDRSRTAMLFAPIPSPAVAITWVLYVLPSDIAVNPASPKSKLKTVVHPKCEPEALAAQVYSTPPLQKISQLVRISIKASTTYENGHTSDNMYTPFPSPWPIGRPYSNRLSYSHSDIFPVNSTAKLMHHSRSESNPSSTPTVLAQSGTYWRPILGTVLSRSCSSQAP